MYKTTHERGEGEMNTITKKYDFFVLTYEFKGKVDKNYERMNI